LDDGDSDGVVVILMCKKIKYSTTQPAGWHHAIQLEKGKRGRRRRGKMAWLLG
jgi:hypothetical protein